jgi:GPH family glycoside/pentoside/hexuronide:cation symporter
MSEAVEPAPAGGGGPDPARVPASTILVYATPVGAVFFSSFLITSFFMAFMTDILLIAPAAAGMIILVGQAWDALNDPPIGHLSDRTRTRWGRRRPWFVASAIPLALCTVALWSPPASLDGTQLVVWTLVAFLLYRTFYSTFRVPHLAFGAELARGYHDRTRVFGGSQIVENVGLLGAAATIGLVENSADPRSTMATIALWMAIAIVVALIGASAFIRERAEFQAPDETGSFAVFGQVLRNPHARLLLIVMFFDQASLAMVLGSLPYVSNWVVETPGSTAVYMLSAVLTMMCSIPLWILASRRFGKREAWMFAKLALAIVLTGSVMLGSGDKGLLIFASIMIGTMAACGAVIGPSIKADIIDWDEAHSGARREGAYFATWNFATKSSAALGGWLLGMSLAVWGYDASLEAQSDETILGILVAIGIIPAVLNLLSFICLWNFKLDETLHRETTRNVQRD